MAGGTPLRIDDELVLRARLEADATDRSVTAQIEHWVKLGMALEEVLAHRQALELKRKGAVPIADALASARSSPAQEAALAQLKESGGPRYGVDPDRPGYLLQILPDGTRRSGRFVNRTFVLSSQEDGE